MNELILQIEKLYDLIEEKENERSGSVETGNDWNIEELKKRLLEFKTRAFLEYNCNEWR